MGVQEGISTRAGTKKQIDVNGPNGETTVSLNGPNGETTISLNGPMVWCQKQASEAPWPRARHCFAAAALQKIPPRHYPLQKFLLPDIIPYRKSSSPILSLTEFPPPRDYPLQKFLLLQIEPLFSNSSSAYYPLQKAFLLRLLSPTVSLLPPPLIPYRKPPSSASYPLQKASSSCSAPN